MEDFLKSLNNLWVEFYTGFGLNLVQAIAFFVIGLLAIQVVNIIVKRLTISSAKLDRSASAFITSIVNIVLYVVLIIVVISTLGFSAASIIAAFSAVALAIALGLQDTLKSLTNGILIIFTKPFKQGDYIEVGGEGGTVKDICLFNTTLHTPDNRVVTMPNSIVISEKLINYSKLPYRRVEIAVGLPYCVEIENVKKIILKTASSHPLVANTPQPMCRLSGYGESSLNFVVRVWCENSNFWDVKFDLMENILTDLKASGIELPFNQLDVHIIDSSEGGLKNE